MQSDLRTGRTFQLIQSTDEETFVRRCMAGERKALRELFERERGHVHALLFRMIGSNQHIDDLVQEAFLEVFRSLPSFRGESSLRTWMDRCTTRVAYAFFAKKARRPTLEGLPEAPVLEPNAEERASVREAARRLYAQLDRLEANQRLAFTLHAVEDLPIKTVAELMDASPGATKLRVWRARRAIEKRAKSDPLLAEFLAEGGSRRRSND